LLELGKVRIVGKLGFVWMNSDAGVDEGVLLGNFDGAVERAGAVAGTNAEDVGYASFTCASDDLLAIRVEARTVKVAVGVDEHQD
jgi:hypothetical protein